MTSSVEAARMIDVLESAFESAFTYDEPLRRQMFLKEMHKAGFHITSIEQVAEITADVPFKIGDRVRFTNAFIGLYEPGTEGGIIKEIDGDNMPYGVDDDEGDLWWCAPDHIEAAS